MTAQNILSQKIFAAYTNVSAELFQAQTANELLQTENAGLINEIAELKSQLEQSEQKGKIMTLETFLAEIKNLSEGLVYISETDAPVSDISSSRPVEEMSAASFIQAMRFAPFTPLDERDFEQFFNGQIGEDNAKWQALKDFLDENLTSKTVFFTTDIQYQVWAVGLFADENGQTYIAGIQSNGVAT